MLYKTRGIVLNQHKFGDSSLIVHIYTEKFGRQSYMVKGGRSRKSKSKANLLRPFTLLQMEVGHKEGKDIQILKEFQVSDPLFNLPFDIFKSTQSLFLAEVLYKVLREEESNPTLFEFLYQCILFLDSTEEPVPNFHLFFLLHLSRFLGFFPQKNYSATHQYFDLLNGSFLALPQAHHRCLDETLSEVLYSLLNTSVEEYNRLKISGKNRSLLLDSILEYYSFHLEVFTEVKSLSVLREIFH
ncbi:MAG: DNA repair protein RecO [Marinifilaceae bacterium]